MFYLIQSCLGHRVVLHAQPVLIAGEVAEDAGQSSLCVWELVLECVVVFLLENAVWESQLDKVLDWFEGRRGAADTHNHRVAITKSGTELVDIWHLIYIISMVIV